MRKQKRECKQQRKKKIKKNSPLWFDVRWERERRVK